MTTDEWFEFAAYHSEWLPVVREAAAIIDQQRAEIAKLQAALRPFASGGEWDRLKVRVAGDQPASALAQMARLQTVVDALLADGEQRIGSP
jgi:hypothetical protein